MGLQLPVLACQFAPVAIRRLPQVLQAWIRNAVLIGLLWMGATGSAAVAATTSLRFEPVAGLNADAPLVFHQDRQGFIWMGSGSGLYRHDGYRSIHYRHDPSMSDSLPSDTVFSLLEDKRGHLWVGTRNGLARFEPRTGRFTPFQPPEANGNLHNRIVRGMVDDGEGGMWLATRGGLLHFDPETYQFKAYTHDPDKASSLPSDNVSVLARDATGGLWVGTWPTGLAYLPRGTDTFQRFTVSPGTGAWKVPSNTRALHVDSRQRLWIGTESGLLLWQTGKPWTTLRRLPPPSGLGQFRVYSIHEDSKGSIWIGTDEGLLSWEEPQQRFIRYSHHLDDTHSLPGNTITSLLVDRTRTLWIGSLGGGISRSDLATDGIEHVIPQGIAPQNFKAGNLVLSMSEDGQGNLWLGGAGGLALINLGERRLIRSYRHQAELGSQLSSNNVYDLYREPGNALWIATNNGLGRLDFHSGRIKTEFFRGPGNNSINSITPGKDDVLWLGTGGSVIRYVKANGTARIFSHNPNDPDSLGAGSNSTLLEDRAGHIWVGGGKESGARGLDILDPATGRVRHYRHAPGDGSSLSSDTITSMQEDRSGAIWLGSAAGLNRAAKAEDGSIRFTRFASGHYISSIQIDLNNHIWAKTPTGLLRLDPVTGKTATYAATDGALDGAPLEKASFRAKDGTLFFGSLRGFTMVTPDAVRQNTTPPQVAITDIIVFNQSILNQPASENVQLEGSVTDPQSLQLSWSAGPFSVEFSALHFADPSLNRVNYRLDGFDHDWHEAKADRHLATYTNINPGEYVFRVKASSKNGVWSDGEIKLPITITPPFWKTWPFRIAFIMSLLALASLIYRWRVRQFTQKQAILEKLVAERTRQLVDKERAKTRFLAAASHDLRQPIQAISLFLATLRRSSLTDEQLELVRCLDTSTGALRGLLNSLLDISKLDAGAVVPVCQPVSLNELLYNITLELSPLAVNKRIRFKLFCPQREITLYSDPQLLRSVLQNLVSNAITYTKRGGVLLAARLRGHDAVSIQVWDTGIGISAAEQARIFDEFYQVGNSNRDRNKGLGLGLSIVKRILTLLDIPLSCRSREGRGTVFELYSPISRQHMPPLDMTASGKPLNFAQFAGKRFIVVEDDADAARSLSLWLQSIGGDVIHYPCAETALADTTTIFTGDYYISDFRLPGSITGIDFLEQIRTRSMAPSVLVTGDTSSEFIEMTGNMGLEILFKPVVPERLLEVLSS